MKRLATVVLVGVATSCAIPVGEKDFDNEERQVTYFLPEITVKGYDNTESGKAKKSTPPTARKVSMLSNPCNNIDTGDLRRNISLKLECVTEQIMRDR